VLFRSADLDGDAEKEPEPRELMPAKLTAPDGPDGPDGLEGPPHPTVPTGGERGGLRVMWLVS
jgi:hypothetical protein